MLEEDDEWSPQEDEEVPEELQKKWDKEEFQDQMQGKEFFACTKCGKLIEKNSFSCLYCGETIFRKSGPLGKLGYWVKEGPLGIVLTFALIATFLWIYSMW